MEISMDQVKGQKLIVRVSGKIDLDTAADFGMKIKDSLDDIKELLIDFEEVTYISSIGLRVLFELQKQMKEQGSMQLLNVQEPVMNVFKMTGLDKILSII